MTPEQIGDRVDEIRQTRGDSEAAHSAEDRLHREVLQLIADGIADPEVLASHALLTTEIEFDRWYA